MRMENIGKDGPFAEEGVRALGGRVRSLRRQSGWTQEELAARMTAAGYPMHQTTVTKIEGGSRPTTVEEAFAFGAVLGVPAGDLVDPGAASERQRLLQLATNRAALAMDVTMAQQRLRHLQEELAVAESHYFAAKAHIAPDEHALTHTAGAPDPPDTAGADARATDQRAATYQESMRTARATRDKLRAELTAVGQPRLNA